MPEKGFMQKSETAQLQAGYTALTRLDWILAPAVSIIAGIWIYFHIYSAINWDDLLYMSLARYTDGQAWILNRYGHIYFLKLFYFFAGDSITGARIFWCFLFSASCILIYFSARILAGRGSAVAAVIAVLLVYMQPMFGREAGSPLADFTVMFLVILGVFIYLAFLGRSDKFTHWLLMLLGLVFFWAVKSKETGICMAVLFFGLGRDAQNLWRIKRFFQDVGWVVCGILLGSLILMLLDAAFVGDFWFSVRPSNISKLFGSNLGEPKIDTRTRTIQSWFSFFTTRPIFVPFLLYLLVGWKSHFKSFTMREKIVWLIPLFLMLFLTFSRRAWYVVPRYVSPAIPIMAIFACQFFHFDLKGQAGIGKGFTISRRGFGIILAAAAFIIVIGLYVPKIHSWAIYYKLDEPLVGFPNLRYQRLSPEQLFYALAIIPVAVTGLLITALLSKKRGLATLFFTALFLFALMLPSFSDGKGLMDTAVVKSRWRYEACRVFKDDFEFGRDTKILISKNVHQYTWMLGRNVESHCHIFNIFFNTRLNYEQFIDGTQGDVLRGDYDYAILIADDETRQMMQGGEFGQLMTGYELRQKEALHPSGRGAVPLILLKKR